MCSSRKRIRVRRDGITLARIRQVCEEMNLASPGRAAAIRVHMRMIGFVRPDPVQPNKREKHYLPTSELEEAIHAILRDDLHALSLIEPDAARAEQRLADPKFFRQFVLRAGEGLFNLRHTLIGTTFFAERDAGLSILTDIVLSAGPGDVFPPKGPLRMSLKDLARRHGVSRAHVFRMFRDAEKLGLLTRDADTQTGTIGDETRTGLTTMPRRRSSATPLAVSTLSVQRATGLPRRHKGGFRQLRQFAPVRSDPPRRTTGGLAAGT